MTRQSEWFEDYEVRVGGDGKMGIYLRAYNVRLATFNCNTVALQTRLRLMFDAAYKAEQKRRLPKPRRGKRIKRFPRTGNDQRDFGFASDVGDQGYK